MGKSPLAEVNRCQVEEEFKRDRAGNKAVGTEEMSRGGEVWKVVVARELARK